MPLVLTRSRLYTLLEKSIINNLSLDNASGVRNFISKSPSGEVYSFTATKLPAPDDSQYVISYGNKPVEVLAPDAASLALTADYDLLMIAPHVSDLGPQDNLPVPDISHNIFRRRMESYQKKPSEYEKLMNDYTEPAHFYLKESSEIGNASERIRQLIPYINQQLVGDGEKVIHHNMDATSPVSDSKAIYPATFALPVIIGRFDYLTIIKNSDELNDLIFEAKNAGYIIKTNPLWSPEIPKTVSPKFVSAREYVAFSLRPLA